MKIKSLSYKTAYDVSIITFLANVQTVGVADFLKNAEQQ